MLHPFLFPWRTLAAVAAVCTALSACGGGGGAVSATSSSSEPVADAGAGGGSGGSGASGTSDTSSGTGTSGAVSGTGSVQNPILFVTQVPVSTDFAARVSTFGNHRASIALAPRGGDLVIRYPDGTLRKLTEEAGYGMSGLQGAQAIAVREPSVHWSGTKALFSMVVGAPTARYVETSARWQIYEVSGLGQGETVQITKVPRQPSEYNNVSPIYGTDDRILFTSDRPRGGEAHLYPQLDEYESTPTVTGLWSLDRTSGDLRLLNHAVSGAFSPSIDSAGRVIYTRWDHLQRDQQADAGTYGAFNHADETAGAARQAAAEVFPEPRSPSTSVFGAVNGHTFNQFTPWEVNEDGTGEETLNHIGRHELVPGGFDRTFTADPALRSFGSAGFTANRKTIRGDGGIFQVREDPAHPGTYFGLYGREFGELGASQIVKFQGGVGMNAEAMTFTDASDPTHAGGRFRNPLPLSDGRLIATHSPSSTVTTSPEMEFTLKALTLDAATGRYSAGTSLTGGIRKSISWYDPDTLRSFNGKLWELEAVEVVARLRPTARTAKALEAPEKSILSEEGVDEAALRSWLQRNDLALIVTRNQTSRDRADREQPYNLQVPGGVKTVGNTGKVYDIAHFQILQADQVRGYDGKEGRRAIAQPARGTVGQNAPNTTGPTGSVKIAADGSTAAFVPARRALTWQTTDTGGNAVVRERLWVTFQPGEVRVCASCHGVNQTDQAGQGAPVNKPEALRTLLRHWNTLPK